MPRRRRRPRKLSGLRSFHRGILTYPAEMRFHESLPVAYSIALPKCGSTSLPPCRLLAHDYLLALLNRFFHDSPLTTHGSTQWHISNFNSADVHSGTSRIIFWGTHIVNSPRHIANSPRAAMSDSGELSGDGGDGDACHTQDETKKRCTSAQLRAMDAYRERPVTVTNCVARRGNAWRPSFWSQAAPTFTRQRGRAIPGAGARREQALSHAGTLAKKQQVRRARNYIAKHGHKAWNAMYDKHFIEAEGYEAWASAHGIAIDQRHDEDEGSADDEPTQPGPSHRRRR
ncbi:hypothetical protein B0H16DRAFT_1467535 [Mycena metata]|uniref:Uncharacterized protein n=1 Tax=Mycena metata TaxID=1033252 RepID=A0AAD7I544_9AGAR|nr:hypothetical protein B0H16DRAFT_1467535 [Mycena metata]